MPGWFIIMHHTFSLGDERDLFHAFDQCSPRHSSFQLGSRQWLFVLRQPIIVRHKNEVFVFTLNIAGPAFLSLTIHSDIEKKKKRPSPASSFRRHPRTSNKLWCATKEETQPRHKFRPSCKFQASSPFLLQHSSRNTSRDVALSCVVECDK